MRKFTFLFIALLSVCAAGTLRAQSAGVELGGVIWAETNVGEKGSFATDVSDSGVWYSFDEARDACPDGWRVPSVLELKALVASGSRWIIINGVAGRRFGSSAGSGSDTGSIFLPAAGYFNLSKGDMGIGSVGYYRSSTPQSLAGAYHLQFGGSGARINTADGRTNNFFVRCVKDV